MIDDVCAQVVEAENRARQVEGHADNVDVYARLHPGARIVIPCLPSKEAGLEAVASAAEAAKEASAQHGSVESAGVASNGKCAMQDHHVHHDWACIERHCHPHARSAEQLLSQGQCIHNIADPLDSVVTICNGPFGIY